MAFEIEALTEFPNIGPPAMYLLLPFHDGNHHDRGGICPASSCRSGWKRHVPPFLTLADYSSDNQSDPVHVIAADPRKPADPKAGVGRQTAPSPESAGRCRIKPRVYGQVLVSYRPGAVGLGTFGVDAISVGSSGRRPVRTSHWDQARMAPW